MRTNLNPPKAALTQPFTPATFRDRQGFTSTRWSDDVVREHLARLSVDPVGEELVAALCSGSRATFTIAETGDLLSVSAKHLYAVVKSAGRIAPGVEVVRSGDRMVVPAHQLRTFLRLPDPHLPDVQSRSEVRLIGMSPALLSRLIDDVSLIVMMRLATAGVIELPEDDDDE